MSTLILSLVIGIVALVLAAARLACAAAIGVPFTRKVKSPLVRVGAALLVGSGLTAAVLACVAWGVSTRYALITDLAICLIALVWNRGELLFLIRAAANAAVGVFREGVAEAALWGAAFILYWLDAIAPPRDGDVVRYHLAHVRQILEDGRWSGIADYHYALPFGWSLNYLPFEALGIPQAAQMMNLALVFLLALAVRSYKARESVWSSASLIAVLLVLHPAVVKAGTTAFADAYAMLVVGVATMLVASWQPDEGDYQLAGLAGFTSWIGIQSRYQLVAFGIAASIAFVLAVRSSNDRARSLSRFAMGAGGAVLLASPFYLMNYHEFHNPVWPFLVHPSSGSSYADIVGAAYQRSQTGAHTITGWTNGFQRLFTYRDIFPIPIVMMFVVVAGWLGYRQRLRSLLIITTVFGLLWVIAQPALYPRFVLYLLPLGVLIALAITGDVLEIWPRTVRALLLVSAVILLAVDIAYSRDSLVYVANRDDRTFHKYTWYYPVYEWANRHTDRRARFAVIVWSGYSYYLDRSYRRADPWLSGEIDWAATNTPDELDQVLKQRSIDYVIYENRDWRGLQGGSNMMAAIKGSVSRGSLVPIRKFHERLYTSRMSQSFVESDVYVLARNRE